MGVVTNELDAVKLGLKLIVSVYLKAIETTCVLTLDPRTWR